MFLKTILIHVFSCLFLTEIDPSWSWSWNACRTGHGHDAPKYAFHSSVPGFLRLIASLSSFSSYHSGSTLVCSSAHAFWRPARHARTSSARFPASWLPTRHAFPSTSRVRWPTWSWVSPRYFISFRPIYLFVGIENART